MKSQSRGSVQRDSKGAYIDNSVMDQRPLSPNLNMLPEITGKVKNIKQLLMKDLEADGVVERSVPHSHRRISCAPSGSNGSLNIPI